MHSTSRAIRTSQRRKLQIAKHLWSGNPDPFEGRHYSWLSRSAALARQAWSSHLIGGSEKKPCGSWPSPGDACNLFSGRGAAAVQAKLDVLKRHCEEVGRDYATNREDHPGDRPSGGGSYEPRRDRRSVSRARLSRHPARHLQHAKCPRDQPHPDLRVRDPSRPWPSSRTRAEMAAVASYGGDSSVGNTLAISRLGAWP